MLFCGINPGLYSAATGYPLRPARATASGRRCMPPGSRPPAAAFGGERLLELGYGLTNLVKRATAAADELAPDEFVAGAAALAAKVRAPPRRVRRLCSALAPTAPPSVAPRRRSAGSRSHWKALRSGCFLAQAA